MTRIIERLSDIATQYDTLYCDLWGCLHDGLEPFPAAVAALQAFRGGGGRVVLMTNAPRPAPGVLRRLDDMGVPRDAYDLVVSSGDAAQAAMLRGAAGKRVYHIGPPKDEDFFTTLPDDMSDAAPVERVALGEAEGIVCTGPVDEDTDTPQDYRATLLNAKTRRLKLLCANPDLIVDYGDRRIYCAGAIAALYDEMGGESLYFGKPHPPLYDRARIKLAAQGVGDPGRVLAIGDGIATDIRGARLEDVDSVFISGGIAAAETGTEHQPDPDKLRSYVEGAGEVPTFAMGFLR